MIFTETNLKGAFVIEAELKEDDRGFLRTLLVSARVPEAGD